MAIPFYEDEPAVAAVPSMPSDFADGDQVDGPMAATNANYDEVDYEGPPSGGNSHGSHNATATSSTGTMTAPSTEEQLLAWKMLALTMCKVLKQFYLQQQQQSGKPTKLTAVVQIQPKAAPK
ncbi:uncharacterized protein LOC115622307 [Scaptodrosophila lebanonensis]|uniref:Uncharacterized protein LOC115622307 n=1 Tax=Drosophila lebanonensis TaxID=7225 RepID=A0A6J2TAU2_DROLE|nr:uncharacterized protein LOC115622307 [Scaptodrosophila lebanonensis]